MDMIQKAIRAVEAAFNGVAGVLLLAMMFLGATDVIGRYVFNSPITGAAETSQLLMGGTIFLAWAYTLARRGHLTVDIFFSRYPKRLQAGLHGIMMTVSVVLFGLVCWQSAIMAMMDWRSGKLVSILLIPVAPFKALVALGALLLCLECLIQIVQSASTVLSSKEI